MATEGGRHRYEARITDERGVDIDMPSTAPERVDTGGFYIDRKKAYVLWALIVALYLITLAISVFLFMRSINQLTSLDNSEAWTRSQLENIYNILSSNSEYLSRSTHAILQNQFAIYQAVNGTATNMLTQNKNLANFISAESHNLEVMKAVLLGLQAKE
jgi:hypothetical protein